MKRNCEECNKEFEPIPYQVKIGTGRYCYTKCRGSEVNKPIPVEDRILNYINF